jgi:hypothetical protein
MESEILHRARMRQTSSRWAKSHGVRLTTRGFIYYMAARREVKKHGRLLDLLIWMGERARVKGPHRHIHMLPIKPLKMGRKKNKFIHCDWAEIYKRQARPVKRQELDGVQWVRQERYADD